MSGNDPLARWKKPEWDDYFMALAFVVAQRSIDPSTKHGAVVVNRHNQVIGVGFNSPPPGMDDDEVPTQRPDKYGYFEHAEANAIANSTAAVEGATIYVTGHPCKSCFRRMRCSRIAKCVYGPVASSMVSQDDLAAIERMNRVRNADVMTRLQDVGLAEWPSVAESQLYRPAIQLVKFTGDACDLLKRTVAYHNIQVRK